MEYEAAGEYEFQGRTGETRGTLEIMDDSIQGKLTDDGPGGRFEKRVDGSVQYRGNGNPVLHFRKGAAGMGTPVWVVELTSPMEETESVYPGKYEGHWQFEEDVRDLMFVENADEYLDGEQENDGELPVIDETPDRGGHAELTLEPKSIDRQDPELSS